MPTRHDNSSGWGKTLWLSLSIAALAAAPAQAAAETKRPNVLWLVADDHAAYVTGCYGNTKVRTPNLDALAASGMRFDRAYCNAPVCTASRQSFLTGRYPRSVGVTLLGTPLSESEVTLAEMLGDAGYDTASFGKMHFNSSLKHGFDLRLDRPDHAKMLRQRGRQPLPAEVEVLPPWKPFRDPARIWLNSMCLPCGATDHDMWDTWFAEQGAAYLLDTKRKERPFFLMVSLYAPHSPFHFPVEYAGRQDPDRFEVPRVGPEDDDQIPAIFRDLGDEEKRGITAAYYTSTEWMDKNMGLVLDALQKSGLAENTIVVYLGDHGYCLGHHGRFEKHCSYEQAARAPLLIRHPGHIEPGSSTEVLVEFIDVVPTLLEYCGRAVPERVQGRSLVRVLEGAQAPHREHVFVEYAWADEIMVRDGRWKLVFIRGKRERPDGYASGRPLPGHTLKLFDLQNDPDEFINLAKRPEHAGRVRHYLGLLLDHVKRTSRHPELIPTSDDPLVVLDYCVQPHDDLPAGETP